jgi:hypothetical protein
MRYSILRTAVLSLVLMCSFGLSAQQLDSLKASRLINRSLQIGLGYSNLLDTYLSTQEYQGTDFRIARESMRFLKSSNGKISLQSFFQADLSYTHNKVDNNNMFAGLVNWNYGLHYQFKINDHLKLLAGGLSDMNLGYVYDLRNSNNSASARAYINLDASGMAIWRFSIKRIPMILRYQLNVPIIGVMFSPEMGESYYEIFSLGNDKGTVKLTSLNNAPSLRQLISLDFPVGSNTLRLSYLADIQQSHVNHIKVHNYSHVLLIGFVKQLYSLHPKEVKKLPASLQAY